MYEDFNYITDDKFLSNYWRQEKVTCKRCQGKGEIDIAQNHETIICQACQGTGYIKRNQQLENPAA